jgi:hypothetical protein
MHVSVLEAVAHEGGALADRDAGPQADEVVVHDVQGVDGRALTNLRALRATCTPRGA